VIRGKGGGSSEKQNADDLGKKLKTGRKQRTCIWEDKHWFAGSKNKKQLRASRDILLCSLKQERKNQGHIKEAFAGERGGPNPSPRVRGGGVKSGD